MAAVDENFRTKLLELVGSVAVEEGTVSEFTGQTRLWFRRAAEATDLHLDGSAGLTTTEFDVEVHSTDIATAQDLAATVRGLNGFYGTMGDMNVLGVFVEDQSDSYEPKGLMADEGFHVPALKAKVMFDGG